MNENSQDVVLIVDDIPTNLGVLFDYLRESNFKVLIAEDGEDALIQVNYAKPDIILLDIMMPGIDGLETCRRLKAQEETKDIPVIFMTALAETVDKVKGLKLGAVDYITKPVQAEEVLARLTTHLTIRKLQRDLQQQVQLRDKLIAELDAFAHTVAHDLKNPLGIIVGYADYLVEHLTTFNCDEDTLTVMGDISRFGQRCASIIDALLLLASVRQEEMELMPLSMSEIISEVQARLQPIITQYNAEMTLPTTWPTPTGYAPWIEEVWANYLSNGIKYGGQPPQLTLGSTLQANGQLRFWVQDNGPGLTPAAQEKLFTEFTRLDKSRGEGHGLGLSIVRRIIDRLGGEVGVESVAGQGSTFYFTLPPFDFSQNY
jgi:signal transduction histidine kinase